MFWGRHFGLFWLAGFVLLALAQGVHAYEHWEIAAHHDCVAHTHAEGDPFDGGSRHEHGCTPHDHAPALAGGVFVLTVAECAAFLHSECPDAFPLAASSIDHPPRLS